MTSPTPSLRGHSKKLQDVLSRNAAQVDSILKQIDAENQEREEKALSAEKEISALWIQIANARREVQSKDSIAEELRKQLNMESQQALLARKEVYSLQIQLANTQRDFQSKVFVAGALQKKLNTAREAAHQQALLAKKEIDALKQEKETETQKLKQILSAAEEVLWDQVLNAVEKQYELNQAREKIVELSNALGTSHAESWSIITPESLLPVHADEPEFRASIDILNSLTEPESHTFKCLYPGCGLLFPCCEVADFFTHLRSDHYDKYSTLHPQIRSDMWQLIVLPRATYRLDKDAILPKWCTFRDGHVNCDRVCWEQEVSNMHEFEPQYSSLSKLFGRFLRRRADPNSGFVCHHFCPGKVMQTFDEWIDHFSHFHPQVFRFASKDVLQHLADPCRKSEMIENCLGLLLWLDPDMHPVPPATSRTIDELSEASSANVTTKKKSGDLLLEIILQAKSKGLSSSEAEIVDWKKKSDDLLSEKKHLETSLQAKSTDLNNSEAEIAIFKKIVEDLSLKNKHLETRLQFESTYLKNTDAEIVRLDKLEIKLCAECDDLKAKNTDLRAKIDRMRLCYDIGVAVSNRKMQKQLPLGEQNQAVIELGDSMAHHGTVLADASLFSPEAKKEGIKPDKNAFLNFYGVTPAVVLSYPDCDKFIRMINMRGSMKVFKRGRYAGTSFHSVFYECRSSLSEVFLDDGLGAPAAEWVRRALDEEFEKKYNEEFKWLECEYEAAKKENQDYHRRRT